MRQRFNTQSQKGRRDCVMGVVKENRAGGMDLVGRDQKCISRSDLLSMSTGAIRFVVGSTTDVLPSTVNFRRWRINYEGLCGFCKKPGGSLEHVLSCYEAVLPAYTRKEVQVRKAKGPQQVKGITFVRRGRKQVVEQACLHLVYMGSWQRHTIEGYVLLN